MRADSTRRLNPARLYGDNLAIAKARVRNSGCIKLRVKSGLRGRTREARLCYRVVLCFTWLVEEAG